MTTIIEEIIEIPNQNRIIYGPGGVGKAALLRELSRRLFEQDPIDNQYFKDIISVSAKRD
jgi:Cdc6-like AAA superfamily ATPase